MKSGKYLCLLTVTIIVVVLFISGCTVNSKNTAVSPTALPESINPTVTPQADALPQASMDAANATADRMLHAYNEGDLNAFKENFSSDIQIVSSESAFKEFFINPWQDKVGQYTHRDALLLEGGDDQDQDYQIDFVAHFSNEEPDDIIDLRLWMNTKNIWTVDRYELHSAKDPSHINDIVPGSAF